jgi:hypothetical protein
MGDAITGIGFLNSFRQIYVGIHHYVSIAFCVEPAACISVSASLDRSRKVVNPTHLSDNSPLKSRVNISQGVQVILQSILEYGRLLMAVCSL